MAKLNFSKELYSGKYKFLSIGWEGVGYFLIPTIYIHYYKYDFVFRIYFLKFFIQFVGYTKEGRKRADEIEQRRKEYSKET